MDEPLEDALVAAHAQGDAARMSELCQQAADRAETEAERAFLLTQAYVYALEAGLPSAPDLRAALVVLGRETH